MEEFGVHIWKSISLRHFLIDLFYTIILGTFIALFLTVTKISDSFFIALVISQSFGISICTIVLFLLWIVKPCKPFSLVLLIIIGVTVGILVGFQLGPFVLKQFFSIVLKYREKDFLQTIIFAITFGGVGSYFFFSKARLAANRDVIQQERILRLSKEKEALEANLRLLQAQIEPHFLFNTLSNILSLIDTNPGQSKAMMTDLIHYLRTSLSRTRHDLITLHQEIEIVKAYLNILKIRMGERLRFRIELPDNLKEQPFPPMLLQPLVENAVKHGIEPQIEGGEVLIKIEEKDGFIRSEIMDSGIGFTAYTEAGVGLANVRERLRMLYGEKGRLMIEENKPRGVKVVIEWPKDGGDPS